MHSYVTFHTAMTANFAFHINTVVYTYLTLHVTGLRKCGKNEALSCQRELTWRFDLQVEAARAHN